MTAVTNRVERHAPPSPRAGEDDPPWQPVAPAPRPQRYSDRPPSWRSRLSGAGGASTILCLIAAGLLFTARNHSVDAAPAALSVFDVAPSAAPPEPVQEVPPAPEEVRESEPQPAPDPRRVDLPVPIVAVPAHIPVAAIERQPPDPGPPVKETVAPPPVPAPPAPRASSAKPTWEGLVLGALNRVKRYPREARGARLQGVPYIRFVMDREGRVEAVSLEGSSGHASLDREALALPRRAQPLPKPPEDVKGETIELVVPVEFFISRR